LTLDLSSEADNFKPIKKFPLWDVEIHHRDVKSSPPDPVLSQSNRIYIFTTHFNIIHPLPRTT